jgi:hypothetical protein
MSLLSRALPAQNAPLFPNFSYVCPEPVLVNLIAFAFKMAHNGVSPHQLQALEDCDHVFVVDIPTTVRSTASLQAATFSLFFCVCFC